MVFGNLALVVNGSWFHRALISKMESSDGLERQTRLAADTGGKHRISAELKRLEQEARLLEVSCSDPLTSILFTYFMFLFINKFGV